MKVCFMRTRRFPGIKGQVLGTVNMRRAEAALKRAVARIETIVIKDFVKLCRGTPSGVSRFCGCFYVYVELLY